ncbi:hypothetical protein F6X38_10860 [Aureimonas leprariae]|uniref:Uncharacterized protein n=1 Tax=Plantimonas leprariae TaxID=2615207 RepID=A0A7V7TW84_9HYPH|nr:hypothetical protein F6X38_10860 [Aureimonas leprariae]
MAAAGGTAAATGRTATAGTAAGATAEAKELSGDGASKRPSLRSPRPWRQSCVGFRYDTPFDAAIVVSDIARSKTLRESRRKSELASVEEVEAIGPLQVTFRLHMLAIIARNDHALLLGADLRRPAELDFQAVGIPRQGPMPQTHRFR